MTHRPTVNVYSTSKDLDVLQSTQTPAVLTAPIRPDLIHFQHSSIALNARQPRGIKFLAGMMHSAHSWGTGRALARIPRVSGSGTHRAGQGAYGNMCRDGRMFAPLRTWRKWQRKSNLKQRRHAVASALAASSVGPLVMARGHDISEVPEVPLVVKDFSGVGKTKDLIEILERLGLEKELKKCGGKRKVRAGKGKWRNRRYKLRKGPLIVISDADRIVRQAARNIAGVEVSNVSSLNLLKLAPGGHAGRFIIWTSEAFNALNNVFGDYDNGSKEKKGFRLQRPLLEIADLGAIINSDGIQSIVRPAKQQEKTHDKVKRNPLKSKALMNELNPFREKFGKLTAEQEQERHKAKSGQMSKAFKQARKARKQSTKAFHKEFVTGLHEAYVPVDEALRPAHSSDQEDDEEDDEDFDNED